MLMKSKVVVWSISLGCVVYYMSTESLGIHEVLNVQLSNKNSTSSKISDRELLELTAGYLVKFTHATRSGRVVRDHQS